MNVCVGSKCVLHTVETGSSDGKILTFTPKKLYKCRQILVLRNRHVKSKLFEKITLPDSPDGFQGYHTECYSKFTALPRREWEDIDPSCPNKSPSASINKDRNCSYTLSKEVNTSQKSANGSTNVCLFCKMKQKKVKRKHQKLHVISTTAMVHTIRTDSKILRDEELLSETEPFISALPSALYYHKFCRLEFHKRAVMVTKKTKKLAVGYSTWQMNREASKKAFQVVTDFIEEMVLTKEEVHSLDDIFFMYQASVKEFLGFRGSDYQGILKAKVYGKIKEKFCDQLNYVEQGNKKLLFSSAMSHAKALSSFMSHNGTMKSQLKRAACFLRHEILQLKRNSTPTSLTVDDVMKGNFNSCEALTQFVTDVVCGPNKRPSLSKKTRVDSVVSDIVFSTSNGRKVSGKHMALGSAVKSLTGSRKLLNILNRLGHCVNYTATEGIETELCFTVLNKSNLLPENFKKVPSLQTCVAFDNYDKFVHTDDGKGTLHDTNGIVVQVYSEEAVLDTQDEPQDLSTLRSGKRMRRSLEASTEDLPSYHKKPKMTKTTMIPLDSPLRGGFSSDLHFVRFLDTLWMISLATDETKSVPMWAGYMALRSDNTQPKQIVGYLKPIPHSPTSYSVVLETMRKTKNIAMECQQDHISFTADLAVAKMALAIQEDLSPQFDNVFIHLGGFHIELALWKAIGKLIDESGGPYVLTESGVLAEGSLRGFIGGTNHARCKRVHQLFSAVLGALHFELFLQSSSQRNPQKWVDEITTWNAESLHNKSYLTTNHFSDELQLMLSSYDEFCNATSRGDHGKTAQFWYIYMQIMQLYSDFERSVRTSNVSLLVTTLPHLAAIFFAFNQPNYARWLVRYHDNLLSIRSTHPGLVEGLIKGGLSVRRTNKPFSATPVDLTVEQTINLNCASSKTGITAFTNNHSCRERWSIINSCTGDITSRLEFNVGIRQKEDVSRDLQPHRIKTDHRQFEAIKSQIMNTINPFSTDMSTVRLTNIGSGKRTSLETEDSILKVRDNGEKARLQFIKECVEDPARFSKPIKKLPVKTFSSECCKFTRKGPAGKLHDVVVDRNLMGRTLVLALEHGKNVNMGEILSYPNVPVPPSLGHNDGKMASTTKSTLSQRLELIGKTGNPVNPPTSVDAVIVDGMFLLYLLCPVPSTFGKLAEELFKKLCRLQDKQVHFVLDQFFSPSIKDAERDKRCSDGNRDASYVIKGPSQNTPRDFTKLLAVNSFKESLIEFIVHYWSTSPCLGPILCGKRIFVTEKSRCFSFQFVDGQLIRKTEEHLVSYEEEADTRMLLHVVNIQSPANIVVRTADTDVLVILLGNLYRFKKDIHIWIEAGVAGKNNLRYVDVHDLSIHLGEKMCRALPGFHSFTGCDYSPAFKGKGKIRPLNILLKNVRFQEAFAALGFSFTLENEVIDSIESFVCAMYGHPQLKSVNEVRLEMFMKAYKTKHSKDPLLEVKGMDGSNFPPCRKVLLEHICRANLISSIWNYAGVKPISNEEFPRKMLFSPEKNGWQLDNGHYTIRWFSGDMSPTTIEEIVFNSEESDTVKNNESDGNQDEDDDNDDLLSQDDSEEEFTESENEEI